MATIIELTDNVIFAYECAGYENRELSRKEIIKMCAMHDYTDAETVNEALETVNDLFTMLAFLGY